MKLLYSILIIGFVIFCFPSATLPYINLVVPSQYLPYFKSMFFLILFLVWYWEYQEIIKQGLINYSKGLLFRYLIKYLKLTDQKKEDFSEQFLYEMIPEKDIYYIDGFLILKSANLICKNGCSFEGYRYKIGKINYYFLLGKGIFFVLLDKKLCSYIIAFLFSVVLLCVGIYNLIFLISHV